MGLGGGGEGSSGDVGGLQDGQDHEEDQEAGLGREAQRLWHQRLQLLQR